MDVLFVTMAAEDELELRSGHVFADNVYNVIPYNAFGSGKVAHAHHNDPALDIGNDEVVLPLLDVAVHDDVLRLPVVRLHRFVQVVSPVVLKREEIKTHRLAAIDDTLFRECSFCLFLVQ